MRNKTKRLKYNFVKIRGQQSMLLLIIGVVKNGRLSTEGFSLRKKNVLLYLKKPRWFRLLLD